MAHSIKKNVGGGLLKLGKILALSQSL